MLCQRIRIDPLAPWQFLCDSPTLFVKMTERAYSKKSAVVSDDEILERLLLRCEQIDDVTIIPCLDRSLSLKRPFCVSNGYHCCKR